MAVENSLFGVVVVAKRTRCCMSIPLEGTLGGGQERLRGLRDAGGKGVGDGTSGGGGVGGEDDEVVTLLGGLHGIHLDLVGPGEGDDVGGAPQVGAEDGEDPPESESLLRLLIISLDDLGHVLLDGLGGLNGHVIYRNASLPKPNSSAENVDYRNRIGIGTEKSSVLIFDYFRVKMRKMLIILKCHPLLCNNCTSIVYFEIIL